MSSCTVFVFASLMEYALVNILLGEGADESQNEDDNNSPQGSQKKFNAPKGKRNIVVVPKLQVILIFNISGN